MIKYIKNVLGLGPSEVVVPTFSAPQPAQNVADGTLCKRCVLPHAPPDVWLDNDGICNICHNCFVLCLSLIHI